MAMEMEQDVAPEMEEETSLMEEEAPTEDLGPSPEFDGPIPGASLTGELGAEIHEKPPVFTEPSEAYRSVATRMQNEEAFKRIVVAARLSVPVDIIARSLVFSGWALGQYTSDVMLLIYGPIYQLMMKMLDYADVEYVPLSPDPEDDRLKEAMEELAELEELEGSPIKDTTDEIIEEPEEQTEEEPETEEPTEMGGLMGRRE
tara:strand:- start:313 stop:918 length:606 start_codon:yes stop_codon:yes gene_type:complete